MNTLSERLNDITAPAGQMASAMLDADKEIKRLTVLVKQYEQQWQPISTCPVYEAVMVCGGDVLYPTTMSTTDEPGAGFHLDAQGMLIDDDTWWPEFWKDIPPAKESDD